MPGTLTSFSPMSNEYFVVVINYDLYAALCPSHIQPTILPKDDNEL
jgi:hypothetical protein